MIGQAGVARSGGKGQVRESSGEEKWLSHLGLPSSEQRGTWKFKECRIWNTFFLIFKGLNSLMVKRVYLTFIFNIFIPIKHAHCPIESGTIPIQ